MQTFLNKLRLFRPNHLLSLLFLLYLAYIASGSLPEILLETARDFYHGKDLLALVDQVDARSEDLLPFDPNRNPLQDKGTYINLNGLMAKNLGQPLVNKRVLLKNGQLASLEETPPEKDDLRYAAENLIRFCQTHQETGGTFLFVMAPGKISKYEDMLPTGYRDTDNETADWLLARLKEAQVPVLDLREALRETGIPWEEAFFATDHHWTPQTGFWAFREITDALARQNPSEKVDSFYTDESNYTFHTFKDAFLGSSGKRTGIYFAGVDDAVFLQPNFPTDIHITIPYEQVDLQGAYHEVCYENDEHIDLSNPDYFDDNIYGLYGWGDMPITYWRNASAPVDRRMLLIGDSFANIPFSLMSICYSSCDEVDMRYFEENFTDYYHNYRPQTLVVLISPSHCVSEFTGKDYL